jgi:hypothetical protein
VSVKDIPQGAATSVLLAASPLVEECRAPTSRTPRRPCRTSPVCGGASPHTPWTRPSPLGSERCRRALLTKKSCT